MPQPARRGVSAPPRRHGHRGGPGARPPRPARRLRTRRVPDCAPPHHLPRGQAAGGRPGPCVPGGAGLCAQEASPCARARGGCAARPSGTVAGAGNARDGRDGHARDGRDARSKRDARDAWDGDARDAWDAWDAGNAGNAWRAARGGCTAAAPWARSTAAAPSRRQTPPASPASATGGGAPAAGAAARPAVCGRACVEAEGRWSAAASAAAARPAPGE